ncbi:unnamed protein product [Calypogeia fissa]
MASTSISNSLITEFEKCNNSISLCHKPVCDPKAEIIFFHDLQWRKHGEPHLQPWMSNGDHSVHWPTCWLSTKFPEARISCACYPGAIWKTETTGHMNLHQITENMRQDIIEIYKNRCPVFLIGHGLGGLIIKRLVRAMDEELHRFNEDIRAGVVRTKHPDGNRLTWFLESIEGLFFYNTPFHGSKLADYMKNLPSGSPLLEIVRTLSTDASRLNEWFRRWRICSGCRNEAIFATLPTKVDLWDGLWQTWWYGFWHTVWYRYYIQVVEEASIRSDVDLLYSIESDHFNACRPCDEDDTRFQKLVQFLQPRLPRTSAPQNQDSAENESSELLASILNDVPLAQNPIFMKREHLDKISKFPEKWDRLLKHLKKHHFKNVHSNQSGEVWMNGKSDQLNFSRLKKSC